MSKAAELTREELVERVAAIIALGVDEDEPSEEIARTIFTGLRLLELVLVPRELTEEMLAADDGNMRGPLDAYSLPGVWEIMLSSSPFAGN